MRLKLCTQVQTTPATNRKREILSPPFHAVVVVRITYHYHTAAPASQSGRSILQANYPRLARSSFNQRRRRE